MRRGGGSGEDCVNEKRARVSCILAVGLMGDAVRELCKQAHKH
jgi:hypothetical protein